MTQRASFASDPVVSRGRVVPEPPPARRTAFQRDRDRIVHATAFRRLKAKTQVFLADEGDHFRTRLTHTLEVAQVARSLAWALGLDGDLTEAIALAHDLGHPPFGHAGERALDRAMRPWGGFDHNAQSLRVVTRLERRYPDFDGLNLTWEVLEGLIKHNGPVTDRGGGLLRGKSISPSIAEFLAGHDLWLWSWPSAEAQCAAIADDIAYDAHDIDDGLRAGLLTLDGLRAVPPLRTILDTIRRDHPRIDPSRLVPELIRRLIGWLIEDVIAETGRRVEIIGPRTADHVREAGEPLVAFSRPVAEDERAIKRYLDAQVYRSPPVTAAMGAAEAVLARLFDRYRLDHTALPPDWRASLAGLPEERQARRIADFLAGMTDRFAFAEHTRLFDRPADLG